MSNFLKTIPVPICGLILGLVSLGNLLKDQHLVLLGNSIGAIGILLMVFILAKVFFLFKHTTQGLKDPIVASVSPTFTMALMVICTYFVQFQAIAGLVKYVWLLAVVVHFVLMGYFIYHHLAKPQVKIHDVYPSWFIVFVGIGVISVTAGKFYPSLGQVIFWVALVLYLALLPIVLKRVLKVEMAEPTLPLITIIAAPGSLCLTGYMKSFTGQSMLLVVGLLILSQILYLGVLGRVIKLLKLPFYPSYAAFTFPLVITATALTSVNGFLTAAGYHYVLLDALEIIECAGAFLMVLYVLIRYIGFLININRTVVVTAK